MRIHGGAREEADMASGIKAAASNIFVAIGTKAYFEGPDLNLQVAIKHGRTIVAFVDPVATVPEGYFGPSPVIVPWDYATHTPEAFARRLVQVLKELP